MSCHRGHVKQPAPRTGLVSAYGGGKHPFPSRMQRSGFSVVAPTSTGDTAPRALEDSGPTSANRRGCVFFTYGGQYSLRLLVAVHSLRRFYDGPITTYLARRSAPAALRAPLERLGSDVVLVDELAACPDRCRLFRDSPYATTLMFDSDLIFRAPIDELWEPLEREGVLVTRFYPAPYGIDGTADRRGWADRVALLEGIRSLVDPQAYAVALGRLVNERLDVNIGVMGIARPRGNAFLAEWAQALARDPVRRALLLDEMTVVAILPKHRHFLAEEIWNCPADEFFRRTNLADARVIHYFADGRQVDGIRLGRNPDTWAGKKWYEAYRQAARQLDLRAWERTDPTFTPRLLRRLLAHGPMRAAGVALREARYFGRRLSDRIAGRLQRSTYFPVRQAVLNGLGRWGYRLQLGLPAKATVIVLSYKRMDNIPVIVRNALLCGFVERVVVSNNNPDVDLTPYLRLTDPRVELVQQPQRRWPSYRYDLARAYPSEYYLCIDDDIFPTPWQLRRLLAALVAGPEAPRGSGGQTYDPVSGEFDYYSFPLWSRRDRGQPVDIILHAYAFTRRHLERYFELLAAIGIRNDAVDNSEDVIISFAGTRPAVVEDVGRMYECATFRDPAVATHRQSGFDDFRKDLFLRLSEVG